MHLPEKRRADDSSHAKQHTHSQNMSHKTPMTPSVFHAQGHKGRCTRHSPAIVAHQIRVAHLENRRCAAQGGMRNKDCSVSRSQLPWQELGGKLSLLVTVSHCFNVNVDLFVASSSIMLQSLLKVHHCLMTSYDPTSVRRCSFTPRRRLRNLKPRRSLET